MSETPVVELVTGSERVDITDSVREMWTFITHSMEWGSGFLGYDEELRWLELGHRLGYDVTDEVANFRNILHRFEETQRQPALSGKTIYGGHHEVVTASDIAAIREGLDKFADDVTGFDESDESSEHFPYRLVYPDRWRWTGYPEAFTRVGTCTVGPEREELCPDCEWIEAPTPDPVWIPAGRDEPGPTWQLVKSCGGDHVQK
jgi:hypothetical protein